MKKEKWLTALLTVLVMMLLYVLPAAAEEAEDDPAQYFNFFLSKTGNIVFTMGQVPDHVYHEADFVRSPGLELDRYMGITDKTQLTCADEQGEWQYHIADLSGMIEEIRADHPEASEADLQINALRNFALFCVCDLTGGIPAGAVRPVTISSGSGESLPGLEMEYSYDDAPGITYRCTGIIDGSRAVLLTGSVNECYEAMAQTLHPVDPESEAAYAARMVPTTVRLGELTMTFPCVPDTQVYGDQTYYDAFSADFSYLSAEHIEMDLSFMTDPDDPDGSIMEMMDYVGQEYIAEGAIDEYEAVLFAPGIGLIKCRCLPEVPDFEDEGLIWAFYSAAHGPYVIESTSSPEGLAFLDSIALAE